MKRIVAIETCKECPYFDYKYDGYAEHCEKLDRFIKLDEKGNYLIPEDCPLEKEKP